MEIPYYGTSHEPVCFYCGQESELQNVPDKINILFVSHVLIATNQQLIRGNERQWL